MGLAIGLGPGDFTGVVLGFEVPVAFRAAETEHFAVVAHEGDAVAWVDWARAEVALLDSHKRSSTI